MRVAVGGTFDPLHDGHDALLRRSLELGSDGVAVGLTSDELAHRTRGTSRDVRPYRERRDSLERRIEVLDEWGRGVEVRMLEDPYAVASEEESFDCLVVSPETREGGRHINELRRERGFDPLEIVVVPHVLAEDGEPISSTRIVEGEIDRRGNLLDSP